MWSPARAGSVEAASVFAQALKRSSGAEISVARNAGHARRAHRRRRRRNLVRGRGGVVEVDAGEAVDLKVHESGHVISAGGGAEAEGQRRCAAVDCSAAARVGSPSRHRPARSLMNRRMLPVDRPPATMSGRPSALKSATTRSSTATLLSMTCLRPHAAITADEIARKPECAVAPARDQFVVAIAVEVRPCHRVAAGDGVVDDGARPAILPSM